MTRQRWPTPKEIVDAFRTEQARLAARGSALKPPPLPGRPTDAEWREVIEENSAELRSSAPGELNEPVDATDKADEAAFEQAHRGLMKPGPLLMSRTNPGGWKLEELLVRVRADLDAKNAALAGDAAIRRGQEHPEDLREVVVAANREIIDLLFRAEGVQRRTLALLDTVGPDPGPLGRPRLSPARSS